MFVAKIFREMSIRFFFCLNRSRRNKAMMRKGRARMRRLSLSGRGRGLDPRQRAVYRAPMRTCVTEGKFCGNFVGTDLKRVPVKGETRDPQKSLIGGLNLTALKTVPVSSLPYRR